jgi:tetratricopeptide (TPR) repeat protein
MWWLWPHFKRIWAMAATVVAGLTINYLYGVWGRQSVPSLRDLSSILFAYWYLTGGVLILLAAASIFAERAHRRHVAPRFIGEARGRKTARLSPLPASPTVASTLVVGRDEELAQLLECYARVLQGERRVAFVSGEAGIGKTTFVNTFIDSLRREGVRVAHGQCVEQYGAGEPYMPMLEALTQLGRGAESMQLLAILHRLAPAWLAQLPALLTAEERIRIQGETQGLTQQRMLREMTETLAALAAHAPLAILLEDLHWSDASTLDLIAAIARRVEPAQLLVIGTYRPVEILAGDHPLRALKQELQLHGHCHELRLKLLSEQNVAAYLVRRFSGQDSQQFDVLAPAIYQRSEGNPLFMVNVVDYLVAQGPLPDASKIEAPHNIQQMIERNLERLMPDEQLVLESASVVGAEFSAAAVAAALERPVSEIEACCARLARGEQFVTVDGVSEWPDGTVASNVRFLHALYREVLYDRVPPGHRVELHRRIAEREEAAYGDDAAEIAAELADHFSRADDKSKAVKYFQLAGARAVARSAMVAAEHHYRCALELLSSLPEDMERDHRELKLLLAFGNTLIAVRGWAAPEVERAYSRARELCQRLRDPPELFPALFGSWAVFLARAELRTGFELAEQLLQLAERTENPTLLLHARYALGQNAYWMAKFLFAKEHLEMAISFYDPERHRPLAFRYGFDAGVCCLSYAAWILWQLGYPDQALKRANEAIALAQRLSHPRSLGWARFFRSVLHQYRREPNATEENAKSVVAISAEHALADFSAWATSLRGWAIAEQGCREEGIAQIHEGLVLSRANGAGLLRPYFLALLAGVYTKTDRLDDGLNALGESLGATDQFENRIYEAETHRLKGELLLSRYAERSGNQQTSPRSPSGTVDADTEEAQRCFQRAVEIARKQSAKSWELRATMSLARLLDEQDRREEACTMLSGIYNWFTEGFGTADLQDAKALLDELND